MMDKPKITPEALVDIPNPHDARISPNGSKVVYSLAPVARSGEHETSSLWIADVGKGFSARQLTSGLFHDEAPQWAPDGEHDDDSGNNCIAFISDRAKAGESSAIYLMDLRGSEPSPITKADNKKKIASFKWDSSGHSIAYTSPDEKTSQQDADDKESGDVKVYGEKWEYNRLRCVHVATRESRTIFDSNVHVKDFAWSAESNSITYVCQQTPDINSAGYHGTTIGALDVSSKETFPICHFPGPIYDFTWLSSEGTMYFLAGATPNSIATSRSLYKLSMKEKSWEMFSFSDPCCVLGLRQDKTMLVAYVQIGLHDTLYIKSSDTNTFVERCRILGEFHTWDARISYKHGVSAQVISKSDATAPPELWSKTGPDNNFCQLSQHGSVVAKSQIGSAKPIYCKSRTDGADCDGIIVRPSSSLKDTKPMPTVMFIHGGPYSRVTVAFDSSYFYWAPYLVSSGYAVLYPNYRGGSSHGEDYAKQAKGAMGTTDYEDVISLLEKGIAQGLIDKDRVVVAGYSQGGFLSYLSVTRQDFHFKGAICGAGVTDWDMMSMTSDAPWFEAIIAGVAPWETDANNTKARHGSAIWHMKNVKTPILILHGEQDVRVPHTQAVAFHRGCLHYGVPCEFVTYPREDHVMKERKHLIDMMKRIRRFCDMHLKS